MPNPPINVNTSKTTDNDAKAVMEQNTKLNRKAQRRSKKLTKDAESAGKHIVTND